MKTCEEYAALLDMYADGFCTEEESERVRHHLAECENCRMYVEQILQMKEAFPDAEETEVPDGFAEGVMAVIRAEAAPQKRQMKPWQKTLVQMAACMAVVIALGPLSALLTGRGGMGADSAAEAIMDANRAYASPGTAMYSAGTTAGGDMENAAIAYESVEDGSANDEKPTNESKSGAATEPSESGDLRAFARTAEVKLTRQQMEQFLSDYQGTEQDGGVAYVLTAAEFDAVVAELLPEGFVPGDDLTGAAEGDCLLMVYPTE